ncbi:MAG: lipid-A-disaccharide synthase [Bdellovibrionales bacterium]|nr:lipid-A-disaccharide synthase [Bdellovibrionales bacterium]
MSFQVLVVAAEASSALYAQRLLEYWKKQNRDMKAFGVGTRAMEDLGFERLGKSEEMAVVGIQEVISHWGIIKGAFNSLLSEAKRRRPDVALLLDYPDFNLRLAAKLKKLGIPVVYYISPQVWAWRQGRVKTIKKCVDKMLVLFPFEKEFYDRHKIPCQFVGHPLLDELDERVSDKEENDRVRNRFGIKADDVLLGLMPGSRDSEIKHHLHIQLETAEWLLKKFPRLKVALLVAPTLDKEKLRLAIGDIGIPLRIIQMPPIDMVRMTDVVLAASGTATLLVGLLEKPMNIMYRMNTITAYLAKKFVKHIPYFGMINLILGRETCPEFFQDRATPTVLGESLSLLVESAEARRLMSLEMHEAKNRLGKKGATVRVAEELEMFFSLKNKIQKDERVL